MPDPRMTTWAQTLTGYSVTITPGNTVAIMGHVAAEPLLCEIAKAVIDRGGHPVVLPILEGVSGYLLTHGTDEQLAFIPPQEEFQRLHADVSIMVMAETNTRRLGAVDPARQARYAASRRALAKAFMHRAADGDLQWTLTLFPTQAYAQDADMDSADFEDFVMRGMKLDQPDPIAAWTALHDRQQRLIDWLQGKREVHVVAPETDLRLSIEGRVWENSDGHKNFPSGEIFTGPVEDSVNGHVRFSFPVVTAGRRIEDIRLRFENGRVVDASAAKNEDYLLAQLDTDAGTRYLGEFAFGTNDDIQTFCSNILFDEKIGGTMHMAVGRGYPQTGSKNESAIHWDMICDLRRGGEVTIDGELFQKDGAFTVL